MVLRYGNIVTANGPESAEMFGKECVKLLKENN
jgi:putative intracellular protease/amidase